MIVTSTASSSAKRRPIHKCSPAFKRFSDRQAIVLDNFFFQIRLTTQVDRASAIADGVLNRNLTAEEAENQHRYTEGRAFKELRRFREINSENLIMHLVNNFLCFLSEAVQSVMLKRPELLRSSEMVKLDEILKFKSNRALISYLVDRKVNELSYAGISGVSEFIQERAQLKLFEDADEEAAVSVAIELRNIHTHNRGVVNETFLRRVKRLKHNKNFELGKYYHADFDEIQRLAVALYSVAERFDYASALKFRIKTVVNPPLHILLRLER